MAAGHRACALCRREDYNRLGAIWRDLHPGQTGADAIDAAAPRRAARRRAGGAAAPRRRVDDLPDGAFVLHDGEPWLVLGAELLHWTPAGLRPPGARPGVRARAITPPSLMAVLRSGWNGAVPLLHPTAKN